MTGTATVREGMAVSPAVRLFRHRLDGYRGRPNQSLEDLWETIRRAKPRMLRRLDGIDARYPGAEAARSPG